MPEATHVPVNPLMVAWAIRESGLPLEAVASRTKVDNSELKAWISGDVSPTKTEFGRFVTVVRRPTSLFFLPKPPPPTVPTLSFRSPARKMRRELTPEERRAVVNAARLQRLLHWLYERRDASPPVRLVPADSNASEAAKVVRGDLGVSVERQIAWADASAAWRGWRAAIEARGIVVLQVELGREGIRGFSLPDSRAPLIAVNSAFSMPARIFSVCHELGHILQRHGSACLGFGRLTQAGDPEERWCEEFAAGMLLPEEAFVLAVKNRGMSELDTVAQVRAVSGDFKVSMRATAIRAIQLGLAKRGLYRLVDATGQDFPRPEQGGGGERRVVRRLRELGPTPVNLVIDAVRSGYLTELDAMRQLRITSHDYDELEQSLRASA
jgi:Zn-dependent peptidase ImmA (M78 family)